MAEKNEEDFGLTPPVESEKNGLHTRGCPTEALMEVKEVIKQFDNNNELLAFLCEQTGVNLLVTPDNGYFFRTGDVEKLIESKDRALTLLLNHYKKTKR